MPQVALLLPTSVKTCRELLRGILKFIHLHGPWAVHIIEGREGEQKLLHPAEWGYTGLIGELTDRSYAAHLLAAHVPTIITDPMDEVLDPGDPLSRLSRIVCENRPIGQHAADYFWERSSATSPLSARSTTRRGRRSEGTCSANG